ncbi:MAG: GFA family protein [Mariprofundaceae bacterium]|nr:GFA family protein [Mariprofundaceae bacterium]
MYQGRCLCGGVRYKLLGRIEEIVFCHCSQCRRVQGSAFASNGLVNENEFILEGEEKLSTYESATGNVKYFCSVCGSPVMSKSAKRAGKIRIRLGSIEGDVVEKPSAHIFASSKANWDHIFDDLPQYDGYEES